MKEREYTEVDPGLAEAIWRAHAFGKTVRALSRIHRLPVATVRRIIQEHEKRQAETRRAHG